MIPDKILEKLYEACNGNDQTFELIKNLLNYEDSNFKNKKAHCQQEIEDYVEGLQQ